VNIDDKILAFLNTLNTNINTHSLGIMTDPGFFHVPIKTQESIDRTMDEFT